MRITANKSIHLPHAPAGGPISCRDRIMKSDDYGKSPNSMGSPERKVIIMNDKPKNEIKFDPCAYCRFASGLDDNACIGCPNNPYPYEDYFETHQL